VVSEAETHAGAGSGPTAVHLLPAVRPRAKAGDVLEVDGEGRSAIARNKADDNTVGKRAGPVGVDLTGYRRRRTGRSEGCGRFAQLILVNVDDALRQRLGDRNVGPLGRLHDLPCS
jgi:hypothetical protein